MNRIEISTEIKPNFFGAWKMQNADLMDEMINFFESTSLKKKEGLVGSSHLDLNKKNSIDLSISPKFIKKYNLHLFEEYFDFLDYCFKDYIKQWPFLKENVQKLSCGDFNIQKYNPGGHFNTWHSERLSAYNSHRVLAWMTYLNDIPTGGETEFLHYKLKIKPEKGKTIIWPAEWTHAHKGNPTKNTKYIITGWFNFGGSLINNSDEQVIKNKSL